LRGTKGLCRHHQVSGKWVVFGGWGWRPRTGGGGWRAEILQRMCPKLFDIILNAHSGVTALQAYLLFSLLFAFVYTFWLVFFYFFLAATTLNSIYFSYMHGDIFICFMTTRSLSQATVRSLSHLGYLSRPCGNWGCAENEQGSFPGFGGHTTPLGLFGSLRIFKQVEGNANGNKALHM